MERKLLLWAGVLVMLLAAHTLFAQTSSGVITYEVKMNMHRRLPPERAEMKAMIPEYRSTKQQLFFNENESLYKVLIEDEEEPMGGGGMQIRMNMPKVEQYANQAEGKAIVQREFMGKTYLIEDSLKVSPWKFGTETKTIQGYVCKQAFYTSESKVNINGNEVTEKMEITAWYTDQIRPFLGPERFNSLPGAVLAVDVNNAERVMVAIAVELRGLKKNELKVPSSGTKTTQAEFDALMKEQMQKMRANGGFIIRN
jgi:GLPGLI family protein